jgi:hypothetical protein
MYTRLGASGQLHAPGALSPEIHLSPLKRSLGGPRMRSGRFGKGLLHLLDIGLAARRLVGVLSALCWVRCTDCAVLGALY